MRLDSILWRCQGTFPYLGSPEDASLSCLVYWNEVVHNVVVRIGQTIPKVLTCFHNLDRIFVHNSKAIFGLLLQ